MNSKGSRGNRESRSSRSSRGIRDSRSRSNSCRNVGSGTWDVDTNT